MTALLLGHSFVNLDQLVSCSIKPGELTMTFSNNEKVTIGGAPAVKLLITFKKLFNDSTIVLDDGNGGGND